MKVERDERIYLKNVIFFKEINMNVLFVVRRKWKKKEKICPGRK